MIKKPDSLQCICLIFSRPALLWISWPGMGTLLAILAFCLPLKAFGGGNMAVSTYLGSVKDGNFGEVEVGKWTGAVVVSLEYINFADVLPIPIHSFHLGGRDAGDFGEGDVGGVFNPIAPCGGEGELAPRTPCAQVFTFRPRSVGEKRATVRIFAGDCAPCTINLVGIGVASGTPEQRLAVAGNPSTMLFSDIEFEDTEVGDTSDGPSSVFKHLRGTDIAISQISIRPWGDNIEEASEFEIKGTTCGAKLAAGSECFTYVRFKPATPGHKTAALVYVTDADNSPHAQRLSGEGVGAVPDKSFGCATPGSCTGQAILPACRSENMATAAQVGKDGKIALAGFGAASSQYGPYWEPPDPCLGQLDVNGMLDANFGQDGSGMVGPAAGATPESIRPIALAIQGDPQLLVVGNSIANGNIVLRRYNSDGSVDGAFGTAGTVSTSIGKYSEASAVALQADDKPVVAGWTSSGTSPYDPTTRDIALARYNLDGTLDTTFGNGGTVTTAIGAAEDSAAAIVIQPDGKIVIAGSSAASGYTQDFALVRYNADGSLDNAFGSGGKTIVAFAANLPSVPYALAIQSDGKLVAAGYTVDSQYLSRFALARLNSDGSLDTTFGAGGKVITAFESGSAEGIYGLAIQTDGKIVAAGYTFTSQGRFALARYNPDGSLDSTFGTGGKYTDAVGASGGGARAVKIQPDGKLVVAGLAFTASGSQFAALRLLAGAPGAKLTPGILNFPAQAVGSASTAQTVTLSNPGAAPLPIASIQSTGDFLQSNDCPATLAKGASCTIAVLFTPVAAGTRIGSVFIVHTPSGSASVLPLSGAASGSGTAPAASLAPVALNFADQNLFAASAPQTVTLANYGAAPLAIGSISASGDYAQTNTCGSSLAPGASCTISVTFTPADTGARAGVLTVTSDAALSPQTLALSGTGVAVPVVGLSVSSLAFGPAAVGTSTAENALTLTNTGTGPLAVYAIFATNNYTAAGTCGTTLAVGASCGLSAAFTPTAEGDLPGWLVIDTNAPGPPSIVTLSGTGTPGTATTTTTTSTAATTTTTSSTTTTTVGGTGGSATLNFVTGWNLTGNSSSEALDIAAAFGDTGKVNTVWKWVPGTTRWAFYAPSLAAQQLSDYAASKGYDVLSSISGGEGFWVNAKSAFSASVAGGTPVETTTFQTDAATGQSKLVTGWNLIAIGDNKTPSQFNASIGATSPAAGQIPTNVTTLWAWDANLANWYFYAPSLEAKGGTVLADYITSKNYLNFGANTLGPTTGFWVNKP